MMKMKDRERKKEEGRRKKEQGIRNQEFHEKLTMF
jgi:hypothetical protein